MDTEKFRNADLKIRELVKLVTVDSEIKLIREDLCEKYDELLLKYATELVDTANDKPKKSEMACNSHIDKTTELKPCLSCGSKDVELVTANPPANPPRIQCNGCDSVFQLVDNSSIDNLVQHWNTRTADESKSKTACNCCAECAEEIDAMEEMNRAVDMFIKAANKLANK